MQRWNVLLWKNLDADVQIKRMFMGKKQGLKVLSEETLAVTKK